MLAGSRKWLALAITAAVALVVCWPVLAHPDRVGFPLSTYPMFSTRRSSAEPLSTVVGIDADGVQHWLDPGLVNGTSEVVQAAAVVATDVASGTAGRLCADVAARVAADGSRGATLARIEVVTVRYDAIQWFAGRREPLERVVHADCPVPGAGTAASPAGR
jgi:hypothetical protein